MVLMFVIVRRQTKTSTSTSTSDASVVHEASHGRDGSGDCSGSQRKAEFYGFF